MPETKTKNSLYWQEEFK